MATKDEQVEVVEETAAPQVETQTNWYYFPDYNFSVEATSHEEAVKIAKKQTTKTEDK